MPSPFPGMDPWVEDAELFGDFHHTLITYLREALNELLPPGYVAGSATRVWVDDESVSEPDVAVFAHGDHPPRTRPFDPAPYRTPGMVAVAAIRVSEPREEAYLEIRTGRGRRLITHVEVVSPSNKSKTQARELYRAKQTECELAGVNLVEIDLLRRGNPITAAPPDALRAIAGPFDYHVCITVAESYPEHYTYPVRLAERLPDIPVPLDPGVSPVVTGLQTLFERCYRAGRYDQIIDYTRPCDPPLTPEQQAWANGILAAPLPTSRPAG